jgi:hypothetical protein
MYYKNRVEYLHMAYKAKAFDFLLQIQVCRKKGAWKPNPVPINSNHVQAFRGCSA